MEKRTHVPADFKVSPRIMELAHQHGWPDPAAECEQFVDYHLAHGTLMLDWEAAFRTWMRNATRFRNERAERSYTKDPRPVRGYADRQPIGFMRPTEPIGPRATDEQVERGRATINDMIKKLTKKFGMFLS